MVRQRPSATFIAVTLALVALISAPFVLDLAPSAVLAALVPLVQWSVALVALMVSRSHGQQSSSDLMALRRGPALGRGLLVALVVFTLVPVVHVLLAITVGITAWQPREGLTLALAATPLVLVMQALFGAGEELGWRGYLHSLLRKRRGFWAVVAITSVVWGLWHVPVALDLALDGALPPRMAWSYVLDIVPWAVVLGALRERFASIWPAVVGHGMLNSVRAVVLQNLTTPEQQLSTGDFWMLHALGWVLWLAAGWAVWRGAHGHPQARRTA